MSTQDELNLITALEPFLSDPEVVEIMIDGPDRVYVEKQGRFVDVPSPFSDETQLIEMIQQFAQTLGRQVNESFPLLDARLFDGSRINVTIPPISLLGPTVVLRKFTARPLTFEQLVSFGAISEEMVEFLRACVEGHLNIIVAGGTGSGKTTVLNLVAGMIPDNERIIVVQNADELTIKQKYLVKLESRPPNLEGKGEISVRDLVIHALRMRPDRLITGEVRGAEAVDILQAMNTGHDGSMLTIHASSLRDVLARLEVMVTFANLSIPVLRIREMIASAIDLITYQQRLPDGSRKVMKIAEVLGMQGDVIVLQDVFEFRQTGTVDGKIRGHFTATGHIPQFLSRLKAAGVDLPLSMFTPS